MLSRTVNYLFWMARHIERADNRGNATVAAEADLRAAQVKARSAGRSQNSRRRVSDAGCSRPGDCDA
jgi:uncharacterized alpha-E superfamily protein